MLLVRAFRRWCQDRNIMFKLNTVVNKYNWEEDMNDGIEEIGPFRWKVSNYSHLYYSCAQ